MRGIARAVKGGAPAVFAAVALMLAGTASPALAAPRSGSHPPSSSGDPVAAAFIGSVGAEALANQDALSVFRGWMIDQRGFANSGYVGSIDDLADKATTIMWYGTRTPLLAAIIAEGERRGITVSVQQRQHSLRQLDEAAGAVWRQAAAGRWAGFKVSSIGMVGEVDNGITVYGTYTSTPAALRAPQVRSLATSVLGVPVHVVPGTGVTVHTGRDNDFSPFNAGGYMAGANGTTCSSGFAIKENGVTHITTARHCTATPYIDRDLYHHTPPATASQTYGSTFEVSPDGGARVLTSHGSALAFDGRYDSDNVWKTVIGYFDVGLNDLVCTGGGNSGEHCNIKVTNTHLSFSDGLGQLVGILGIQQSSGAIASMSGDSGGPVISLTSTSPGQVRAAGMIQAGWGTVMTSCGPVYDVAIVSQGTGCTTGTVFTSMRTIVNSLGDSLVTG